MTGRFKKSQDRLWALGLIISGLFIVVLFAIALFNDEGVPSTENLLLCAFFLLLGLASTALGVSTAVLDKRVHLQLTEDGVEVFASYYFYGRRIFCKYEDIVSVSLRGFHGRDTLYVRCLDEQKDFEIPGLENGVEILYGIQSRLCCHEPTAGIEDMKNAVSDLSVKQRAGLKRLLAFLAAWFAAVVALIFITDGKEIRDFNRAETAATLLSAAASAGLLAAICLGLRRLLRLNASLYRARDELTRTLLRKTPCRMENAVSMYLVFDARYVVCREPGSGRVYYVTEIANAEGQIAAVDCSRIFASESELRAELWYAMEVPLPKEQ